MSPQMQELTAKAVQNLSLRSEDPSQSAASKLDTVRCKTCNKTWNEKSPHWLAGQRLGQCEDCRKIEAEESFTKLCPPLYQKTDPARLPAAQLTAALQWKLGPRGLIMLGETGLGKSRVAWLVIRQTMLATKQNLRVQFFDGISFGHEIARHYRKEDAEDWLDSVANAHLVFFDDLGKLKLTERAEVELFGLIERRCAAEKPVIVTTNDTGDTLAARMTDNRGPALIRRLREFCDPIQF